jgi:hypothetical protein
MATSTATKRKLVLKMSVSLDGFVGGPDGGLTGYSGQWRAADSGLIGSAGNRGIRFQAKVTRMEPAIRGQAVRIASQSTN